MPTRKTPAAFYFHSLAIQNVRCFAEHQCLRLNDGDRPARWTLILGDNGVGKTTLLQCLTWMLPVREPDPKRPATAADRVGVALQNEENPTLYGLIREATLAKATIEATVSVHARLASLADGRKSGARGSKRIRYGIELQVKPEKVRDFDFQFSGKRQKFQTAFGANYPEPLVVAYGANRRLGERNLERADLANPIAFSRLGSMTELYDVEQILIDLDHASRRKDPESREQLKRLKAALARILPGNKRKSEHIQVFPPDLLRRGRRSGVHLKTEDGLVRLRALSLGYQTMLAWTTDLAWRLIQRYRTSANPLSEPAVVLIDEIDLHLHPLWQLTIIDKLSALFPGTQFVATAHSPLMVQVAETANIMLLRRRKKAVEIANDIDVVRTWRVDQILMSELFDVPNSRNKRTEDLIAQRDALLDKASRTAGDERTLARLRAEIARLPTAPDPADQMAMEIIRKAATLLKKHQAPRP